jgi:hypothetical protein
MTEALRRRLTQAAEKRGVSLTTEMLTRLENSFDQPPLSEVTQRLETIVGQLSATEAPDVASFRAKIEDKS